MAGSAIPEASDFDCGGPPAPERTNSPQAAKTRATSRAHDTQLRSRCTLERGLWDKASCPGRLASNLHPLGPLTNDLEVPSRIPRLALGAGNPGYTSKSDPFGMAPGPFVEQLRRAERVNEVLSPRSDQVVNSLYGQHAGASTKSMRSSLGRSSLGRSSKSKIPTASSAPISAGLLKPCLSYQPSPRSDMDKSSMASQDLEGLPLSVGISSVPTVHFHRVEQSRIPKLMGRAFPVDGPSATLSPRDGMEVVDGDLRRSLPMWSHCGNDWEQCKGGGCSLENRRSLLGRSEMTRSAASAGGGSGTPRTTLSHLANCSYTPPRSPVPGSHDWATPGKDNNCKSKEDLSGNSDDDALSSLFDENRDVRQSMSLGNASPANNPGPKPSINEDAEGELIESVEPCEWKQVEVSTTLRVSKERVDMFEKRAEPEEEEERVDMFEKRVEPEEEAFVSAATSVASSAQNDNAEGGVSEGAAEPRGITSETGLDNSMMGNTYIGRKASRWKIMVGITAAACALILAIGFATVDFWCLPADPGTMRIRLKDRFPSALVCSPLSELQFQCLSDSTSLSLYKMRGACPTEAERAFGLQKCPARALILEAKEESAAGGEGSMILSMLTADLLKQACMVVALSGAAVIFVMVLVEFMGRFRVGG